MNPHAMDPLGMALRAFQDGNTDCELVIRRDDGVESRIPVAYFFRDPRESSEVDQLAIDHARGRVLDVGAGSGLHSLVLQEWGLSVTAIDVSRDAVEVMKDRGVRDAREADVFDLGDESFDTILMMGHGIGIVETIAGLDRFLSRASQWLVEDGRILLDSLEVHATRDASTLAYHEANRKAGRYIGEVRVELQFEGHVGPPCGWLHVDSETLIERANTVGFECEVLARGEGPDYLAQLTHE